MNDSPSRSSEADTILSAAHEFAQSSIPNFKKVMFSKSRFGSDLGLMHYLTENKLTESNLTKNNPTQNKDDQDQRIFYIGLQLEERHGGAPGRGHGGVTMTVLDEVMGRAASVTVNSLCVTVSMTTNFCEGSQVGERAIR